MSDPKEPAANFIRHIIDGDLAQNKNNGRVHTRFPPEPNGYLHIGHAKAIWVNFGIAESYKGKCNLRFDDTNPLKEDVEYAEAIKEDVKWLGYDWEDRLFHASDYFQQLHDYAVKLIQDGKAYVCQLTGDEIRETRGTLTEAGKNSPYRDRSIAENLQLFEKMKNGEFADGKAVLRAKIDMTSANLNLRDPVIYRVRHASHPIAGDKWCIYPMYDYAHCVSDAIEGITHSLCTLEFEDHRPLYDWYLDQLDTPCHPQQIEFARLEVDYVLTSKRKLLQLVEEGKVDGWDDPRMPTLAGLRNRGIPPEALIAFVESLGISKNKTSIDIGVLENTVRDHLGPSSPRAMAVLDPIKLLITNWPEDKTEALDAPLHPQIPELGTRTLNFGRELYIEREDFMEDAPKKFFRLKPGGCVRLRYGYVVDFENLIKDDAGNIVEIHCSYDPQTRSGSDTSGRKVKGTIHWLNAKDAVAAEIRLYDRLFTVPSPDADKEKDFHQFLNPDSLLVPPAAYIEPWLLNLEPEQRVQFERTGYFCRDRFDKNEGKPVFNRIVTLRDSWAKQK